MSSLNTQNLQKWVSAIHFLNLSQPDLQVLEVMGISDRNLVVLVQNSNYDPSVIKISHHDGPLRNEIKCLSHVSAHPNIVIMKEAWTVDNFLFVQFEKVRGICLIDVLAHDHGKFSEDDARQIFKQLVSAVMHLHSKGWFHRDLKPDNLIYDRVTGQVKLIDFEFASMFTQGERYDQKVGTCAYMCPEMKNHQPYDPIKAEVWSLGVSLYAMLTACFPFHIDSDSDSQPDSVEVTQGKLQEGLRQSNLSEEAQEILQGMMNPDPSKRMDLKQIVRHRWFKNRHERHRNVISKILKHWKKRAMNE